MTSEVTLTDVAQAAGVSRAAASRALNGREGVRPEVRNRVKLISDALGYRPNRAARNLGGGRASVIGVLLGTDDLHVDVYGASLLGALSRSAHEHDEGLMLLFDTGRPNETVRNLISDGLIDGVVISSVAVGKSWTEGLLDANFPTVLLGAHPRRNDVPVVDVENAQPTSQVVGHMLDSGCERVAMVTGDLARVDASLRLEGYHQAHQERSLEADPSLCFGANFERLAGYELTDEILATNADGVFCASDEMALGLYGGLAERGVSVPGDISLAGFDGTAGHEVPPLDLTTVRQPFQELADTAVKTLQALLQGQTPPLEQLLTPEIHWGATTGVR